MRASYLVAAALLAACSVPEFFAIDASGKLDGGSDATGDGGADAAPDMMTDAAIDAPLGATTITNVTSPALNRLYGPGIALQIQLTFSHVVTVTGTPTMALNSGGTASYASGSGSTMLEFTYTTAAGQQTMDLDYATDDALVLAGGTITNTDGDAAFLALPSPGGAGSLAGNKAIAVDGIAPTVTGITGPAMFSNSATAMLTYAVSDANVGTTTCMQTAGTGTQASCTNTGAMYTGLSQGAQTVTITHTDLAGNVSTVRMHAWTVDTIAATVGTITGPAMFAASTSGTLNYSVSDANPGTTTCTHTLGTGTTGSCTNSTATFTALSQGAHTITIGHTDLAGNVTTGRTYSWTVDTVAPTVGTISGPAAFAASTNAALTYTVTEANPDTTSCVHTAGTGTTVTCTESGATFSGLSQGAHTITITHQDLANNTSTARTYMWTVDTVAPVIATFSGPSGTTSATTAALTYSITDANAGTTTCNHATGTGTETACTNTTATYTALSPGAHAVTISHTDLAGNVATPRTASWSSCPSIAFTSPSAAGVSFTIPTGCGTTMDIFAWGGGGGVADDGSGSGGGGGFVGGTVTVTPGQVYTISVGGGSFNGVGGINGGGRGGASATAGGGGGGWSGVTFGATRLVIAAGGGGAGGGIPGTNGGAAGGANGQNGQTVTSGANGGFGATQTLGGGGGAGTGGNGTPGVGNAGGRGADGLDPGGGGGGGHFGGGGGASANVFGAAGAGGGGSSNAHSSVTNVSIQGASGITPGGTANSNYVVGVGVGGSTTTTVGHGRVVVIVH